MRTARDRLRHAILFELIALLIAAPLGSLLFAIPLGHFGVVAAGSTTIAMGWNYVYNLIFDHALVRLGRSLHKTFAVRVLHSLLFEGGLVCLLVPFIAWYLGVPLWQAFVMDISLSVFYLVFAFAFNWGYDIVFPLAPRDGSA